jgi:formamidopyrimidine-DNA glycosylase
MPLLLATANSPLPCRPHAKSLYLQNDKHQLDKCYPDMRFSRSAQVHRRSGGACPPCSPLVQRTKKAIAGAAMHGA